MRLNDIQEQKTFVVRFSDKAVWNEFKDDLKTTLKKNEIKFQYSDKAPNFHILYKSDSIKIRVVWEDETLVFHLQAEDKVSSEQIDVCREIFDLLILFSGELIMGKTPYEW